MVPSCISCQLEQCRYPRWTAVRDACRTLHIPDNQPKRRKNTALVNCIYLFRMHAWSRTEWSLVWFIGFEITLWFVTNVGIEDKWHTRYAKTLILWQTLLTAKKTAWASGMTNTRTFLDMSAKHDALITRLLKDGGCQIETSIHCHGWLQPTAYTFEMPGNNSTKLKYAY